MRKAVLLVSAAMVCLGCLVAAVVADNQSDAPAAASPFKGKILVVTHKSDSEFGDALQEYSIQRIGDRDFLVGTGVDYEHEDNWQRGKRVWVALDDVAAITEFESVEEMKKLRLMEE